MPNIEDSNNTPIQPNLIGKKSQKPQGPAGIPAPQDNNEDTVPKTDLRKDPKAAIGRSAVDFHPLAPETKANVTKDVAVFNEFLAENRDFADFLLELRDAIRAKYPDWTQDQVIDLTMKIAQELGKQLEEQLKSA